MFSTAWILSCSALAYLVIYFSTAVSYNSKMFIRLALEANSAKLISKLSHSLDHVGYRWKITIMKPSNLQIE